MERRIARLEADRAIRDLKARYLAACDARDPDGVRDTLLPQGAVIAFEGFPLFEDREPFVAAFTELACVSGTFDVHHAANGVISFEDEARARGQWSLIFLNINLAQRTLTQMGTRYDDVYVKHDGRWWIAETRSRQTFCLVQTVDSDRRPEVVVMERATGAFAAAGER